MKTLQARDVSSQGEICTYRRNGLYHWTADTFAQQLITVLGTQAIPPPASDTLTLTSGHIYHLPNLERYNEFHGVLATSPAVLLLRAREPERFHEDGGIPGTKPDAVTVVIVELRAAVRDEVYQTVE